MACPTPNKKAYMSKAEAEKHTVINGAKLKSYYCAGCFCWHTTSKGISNKTKASLEKRGYLKYYNRFKALLKK